MVLRVRFDTSLVLVIIIIFNVSCNRFIIRLFEVEGEFSLSG